MEGRRGGGVAVKSFVRTPVGPTHSVRVLHRPQLRWCWSGVCWSRGSPGERIGWCILSSALWCSKKPADGAIPFFSDVGSAAHNSNSTN